MNIVGKEEVWCGVAAIAIEAAGLKGIGEGRKNGPTETTSVGMVGGDC